MDQTSKVSERCSRMEHQFDAARVAHAIGATTAASPACFRIYGSPKYDESLTNTSTRMPSLAVKFGNLHAREQQFLLRPQLQACRCSPI
jgi:hypothetical protein